MALRPQEIRYANNCRQLVASQQWFREEPKLAFGDGCQASEGRGTTSPSAREGHGPRDAFVQADVAAFISAFLRIG